MTYGIAEFVYKVEVINEKGSIAGIIQKKKGEWVFDPSKTMINFTEQDLRQIANEIRTLNWRE